MDQLISKTIYISLFMQIFTTTVSAEGILDKLYLEDVILQDILKLELFVQITLTFSEEGSSLLSASARSYFSAAF